MLLGRCDDDKKCPLACGLVGAILLGIAGVSWPVVNHFIKLEVRKNILLIPGTQLYDMWKEPTIPIFIQFYVFDLQNPSEVLQGHKPYVVERGPYSYREYRKKVDIKHNDNGTITYKQLKRYRFDKERSIGQENDTFTTANIALLALVEAMRSESTIVKKILSLGLSLTEETVFIEKSVKDIVWGYEDALLHIGQQILPHWFYTDKVGVLTGKNNTDDGTYTIWNGVSNISRLGVIDKYNGSNHLPFWTTKYANMINGTDGTIAPPFITKDLTLYLFSTDVCRSVYGTYNGSASSPQGIPLLRFTGSRLALASPSENPDNVGFCTPAGHCMGTGVLNISTCQLVDHFHAPLVASLPHFTLADQKYIDAIGGMNPDWRQYNTDIDIEPTSGIVMHIAKRLQVNIYIESSPHVQQMSNVSSMVYPMLWINESATIDDASAHKVSRLLLTPLLVIHAVQYTALALGAGILLISVIVCIAIKVRKDQGTSELNVHEPHMSNPALVETEPLMENEH